MSRGMCSSGGCPCGWGGGDSPSLWHGFNAAASINVKLLLSVEGGSCSTAEAPAGPAAEAPAGAAAEALAGTAEAPAGAAAEAIAGTAEAPAGAAAEALAN
jgi:hypothetical protein